MKKRDPEQRKRQIIEAAACVLMQEGSAKFTHRRIAEQAGVPLGSTTHYFASIDDLKRAGLEYIATLIQESFDEAFRDLKTEDADASTIAHALYNYLKDTDQVRADTFLYTVAISDPDIRPLAMQSFDAFVDRMSLYLGEEPARALAVFMDGASLHACLHDEPLDEELLLGAVQALMEMTLNEQEKELQ